MPTPSKQPAQSSQNGISHKTKYKGRIAILVGTIGTLGAIIAGLINTNSKPQVNNVTIIAPHTETTTTTSPSATPAAQNDRPTIPEPAPAESLSVATQSRAGGTASFKQAASAQLTTPEPPAPKKETPPLFNQRASSTPLGIVLRTQNHALESIPQDIATPFHGTTALFTPAFIANGYFDRTAEGDTSILINEHAERYAQAILLGTITIATGTDVRDASLNVVTATCDAKLYIASEQFQYRQIRTTAKGVDYNRDRAIAEATRELTTSITSTLRNYLP